MVALGMYVCKRCYDSHYIGLDARYFNAILEQKKVQEEESKRKESP